MWQEVTGLWPRDRRDVDLVQADKPISVRRANLACKVSPEVFPIVIIFITYSYGAKKYSY